MVAQYEHAVATGQVELESAREKERQLARDVFTLRAEREETKHKMTTFQHALQAVKQQSQDIQTEFLKSREFYKNELTKAFERKTRARQPLLTAIKLQHPAPKIATTCRK